jgi:hypothetical protein
VTDISDSTTKLKLYFANNLFALDCNPLKFRQKYFYFSKQDLDDDNEKWKTFASAWLSPELQNQIKQTVKRINSLKVFI